MQFSRTLGSLGLVSAALLSWPFEYAVAESTRILGVHPRMEIDELNAELSRRSISCEELSKQLIGCGNIAAFIAILESGDPRLSYLESILPQRLEEFGEGKLNDAEAIRELRQASEVAAWIIESVPILIVSERLGKRTMLISCAAISACGRSQVEIMTALEQDIGLTATAPEVRSPDLIGLLEDVLKASGDVIEPKPSDVMTLTGALAQCAYGRDRAKVCIYDGRLTLSPGLLMSSEFIGRVGLKHPELSVFLATFGIQLTLLEFEEARETPRIQLD